MALRASFDGGPAEQLAEDNTKFEQPSRSGASLSSWNPLRSERRMTNLLSDLRDLIGLPDEPPEQSLLGSVVSMPKSSARGLP